jgi:hypothetical protein
MQQAAATDGVHMLECMVPQDTGIIRDMASKLYRSTGKRLVGHAASKERKKKGVFWDVTVWLL